MSEADLSLLKNTAELCPADYGDVVHWAIGLLTSYHADIQFDESSCMQAIEPREGKRAIQNIEIYPNPAYSELNIVLPKSSSDDIEMKMYSSQGEEIGTYRLKEGKNTIHLSPDIISGLYIVRINGADGLSYIKKVVIHK